MPMSGFARSWDDAGRQERQGWVGGDSARGCVQRLAKINHSFGLGESPRTMGGVGDAIIDERIGADFAKAACDEERFDMRHQLGTELLPPEWRFYPNAFEERHRAALTAIGIGTKRDLGKSGGLAFGRF